MTQEREIPLHGGNVSTVSKVGDTVRRNAGPWTPAVHGLLNHLERVGFTGSPSALGMDDKGREVLSYLDGECGEYPLAPHWVTEEALVTVATMLRMFHDAQYGFVPPPGAVWRSFGPPPPDTEVICHHDAAPWNLVRAERGWVLIDWDNAGPGSRAWELAYSALSCCGMRPEQPVPESAARLRSFVDAYGLEPALRPALAGLLGVNARAMYDLLATAARDGRQPWARIYTEDGGFWRGVADYLDAHRDEWTSALG